MEIWQIWEDGPEGSGPGGITLIRKADVDPARTREQLGDQPRLVREFEAGSDDEARQVQYDHYGWGEYVPMDEPLDTAELFYLLGENPAVPFSGGTITVGGVTIPIKSGEVVREVDLDPEEN